MLSFFYFGKTGNRTQTSSSISYHWSLHPLWKHQEVRSYMILSAGIEKDQWQVFLIVEVVSFSRKIVTLRSKVLISQHIKA